jgi:cytochrome P450 family 142 subfamily A polypeptide 1
MQMSADPVPHEIDLLAGTWYSREPHDAWTWMRQHDPVHYDEKNDVWAITRYRDVLQIEKDPATFSSRRSPRPHGDPLPMMISMDNPQHQRRRSLVNRGFTPRQVAEKEPTIRRLCTEIIDRVCERGSCDFVWDIAAPLPLLLIADMLGFERDAYDDLLRWSDDLIRGTTVNDEVARVKAMEAGLAFREYQLGVIADRRAKPPQPDLVSTLCYAELEGERLDDESLIQETLLILIGGDETTRHVISGGMLALLDHPDQRDLLRARPEAVETGVEELLRWVTPIKNMSRTVSRDVELRDRQLHEGDQLILLYPSANRDEDVFADPFRLDVGRDPNPHLAFGFGPHFCLGAALARLELKVMFSELLARLPDIELATDEALPYRASNFIVGPEAMPIRFTPTPVVAGQAGSGPGVQPAPPSA